MRSAGNRSLRASLSASLSLALLSLLSFPSPTRAWGTPGHRIIGHIAEHHLSPEAARAVADLIGPETLASAGGWADAVRSEPGFAHTGPWHYVNLAAGEAYDAAPKSPDGDVVWAVRRFEAELRDRRALRAKRAIALKLLLHFVGDVHQPLHVGPRSDRGGNGVEVRWRGEPTTLHRVWDVHLIDRGRLSPAAHAALIDHATSEQMREWQSADLLGWVAESQALWPRVYAIGSGQLGPVYRAKNRPLAEERLLQAGLRLAGMLNEIFAPPAKEGRPGGKLPAESITGPKPAFEAGTGEEPHPFEKETPMPDDFPRGRFCWFDLMTTDPAAAEAFYKQALGWGTTQWEGGPTPYTMWARGETTLGGLMQLPEEAAAQGAPPHWLSYIATPDVEATCARAKELGATVMVPPTAIPTVGSFAVLADPQGATFAAFTPTEKVPGHDGQPELLEFSWHELATTDYQAALAFYTDLFGWEAMEAMDMGPAGIYQLYGRGGLPLGGMFNKPPEMPAVCWLYYVLVEDVQQTVDTVQKLGGGLLNGPMEVPGGDWIAQLTDPQGAAFAVHHRAKGGA